MPDPSVPTQLYLTTPAVSDAAAFAPALSAAMQAGPIACVLVSIAASDDHTAKRIVKHLAPIVQGRGAALLLNGWSTIVARAGADGIHLAAGRPQLHDALEAHKPERIVGVAGLRSKDDAMSAGDMVVAGHGIDYVMFGESQADGRQPALAGVVERTAWWAEIFEVPCVVVAPDFSAIPLLADAGADFVALGDAVWCHAQGAAAAIERAAALLARRGAAA